MEVESLVVGATDLVGVEVGVIVDVMAVKERKRLL
jgi:hypothetical protein